MQSDHSVHDANCTIFVCMMVFIILTVAAFAAPAQRLHTSTLPTGFNAAYTGFRVNGSQIVPHPSSTSAADCAVACLARMGGCIAFNWVTADASTTTPTQASWPGSVGSPDSGLCELSGWGSEYTVVPNQSNSVYYTKSLPRNDSAAVAKVQYKLTVPTSGVRLTGGPFATAFATNLVYLNQFPVEDMLYWFRQRAGVPNAATATSWGWDGHTEPLSHDGWSKRRSNPEAYGHVRNSVATAHGATTPENRLGHCNPGGDPTVTIKGLWKDPRTAAVYTIDQPGPSIDGGRAFTAQGPGWSTDPPPHGQVFPNGSFWIEISGMNRSTGVFGNSSSWTTLCWWTAITWTHTPGGEVGDRRWCKVGSANCSAQPGPPPPSPGPPGVPPGINVDGPFGLRGSVAGAFMMGSGGATRWAELPELRARLEALVGNISALQGDDGFAMAFLRNETNSHENPNYVQSWVTHGLLEADSAGVPGAAAVLRKHYDWFNYATDVLARMLPPLTGPPPKGQPTCSRDETDNGHCVYLIYQGMIHNTRVATSSVGTARDIQVVQELYEEEWWLTGLAARNTSMIWLREASHNYEITAFEAYFDMYMLTGEVRYLLAMEGAWDLMRNYWIHVGGSIALNEGGSGVYPPGSYFLGQKATGELCGSSFWIRFNQRYHRLRPSQEVYTAEIERSLINVILANQAAPDASPPGIRYFAQLEGSKATPTNVVTCCESQGTRTYGALPEFVYSTSILDPGIVYVNLFVPSTYQGKGFTLTQSTGFPTNGNFSLALATTCTAVPSSTTTAGSVGLMLRIPSWSVAARVALTVKDAAGAIIKTLYGTPGSYLAVQLADAQIITADFGMGLRVSMYNGSAPIDPFSCNSPDVVRAAVQWGPVLLAATYSTAPHCATQRAPGSGPWAPAVTVIGIDPARTPVAEWLTPAGFDRNDPLFAVKGTAGCTLFRPYFSLQNESFSVYPNFLTTAGLDQRAACGVTPTAANTSTPAVSATVCLVCPTGHRIASVVDAQFGVLSGGCVGGIKPERCLANSSHVKEVASQYCDGTQGCSVPVDPALFGTDPCPGVPRSLAVSVACVPEQCDVATENWPKETDAVHLECPTNRTINVVLEAEFGILRGNCTVGFHEDGCTANSTLVMQVVESRCLGKPTCTVAADKNLFPTTCSGTKQLAVKVACK